MTVPSLAFAASAARLLLQPRSRSIAWASSFTVPPVIRVKHIRKRCAACQPWCASASPARPSSADGTGGGAAAAAAAAASSSAAPPSRESPLYTPAFISRRRSIFVGMVIMYAMYVALRATWTFVSPVAATALGLSLNQVGFIASAFPLLYGMSRLITGILADRSSPARALGAGLGLAGLVNILMSCVSRPLALAALWGVNGLVQGVGAGASAKLLTSWHSRKERGFWWAVWSSSANLGGFLAPIVCGYLSSTRLGFRAGLFIPGMIALAFATLVTPLLKDSPADAGLVAPWAREEQREREDALRQAGVSSPSQELSRKLTLRESLVEGVLKNKYIWALAAAYFLVYFLRFGLRSWMHFYLVEARAVDVASSAYRASGMEVGGVVGTLAAGMASDALDGRRVAVTIAYMVGLALTLCLMVAIPSGSHPLFDIFAISMLGFFVNGPQCLIGLIGAEVSDVRVVATATGVLGWISYGGAAASGYPLSVLIRMFGWKAFFMSMVLASLGGALILLPMSALRGRPKEKTVVR